MSNHYTTLEVEPSASYDDIKKQFRRLQLKLHPDKDSSYKNKQKYDEICHAFAILGDPDKREEYDSNNNQLSIHQHTEPIQHDILGTVMSTLFAKLNKNQQQDPLQMLMTTALNTNPNVDANTQIYIQPLIYPLHISYNQSFHGCVVPIHIKREQTVSSNTTSESETIYVTIPPGIDNNEIIILKQKGHCVENDAGDIKVVVNLDDHPDFCRDGLDLVFSTTITLKQALCGFSIKFEHLNGRLYNIDDGGRIVKPNHIQRISGLGFTRDDIAGDLVIAFRIEFPSILDPQTIDTLNLVL